MYLISGTLFFITSFFIFIFNYVSYNDKLNGFISFLAFISLIMGVVFTIFSTLKIIPKNRKVSALMVW